VKIRLPIFLYFAVLLAAATVTSYSQEPPPICDPEMYSYSSFRYEKYHLEEYAKIWRLDTKKSIYLVAYGSVRKQGRDAKVRLDESKRYLVDYLHVPRDKVVTVLGSNRNVLTTMIWIVDPEKGPESPCFNPPSHSVSEEENKI
jgi:hypothetical protein